MPISPINEMPHRLYLMSLCDFQCLTLCLAVKTCLINKPDVVAHIYNPSMPIIPAIQEAEQEDVGSRQPLER
jgi:hypothetical protein